MSDNLFSQLQARSSDEIFATIEKLEKQNRDYAYLMPVLKVSNANVCKMLRFSYDNHIANGFTEDQAMTLILGGK